jgi:hypothetical protein
MKVRWNARKLLCGVFFTLTTLCQIAQSQTPAEIYEQRIIPLLKSDTNRCSQCHLSGIDLRSILSEDPAATFASLRARGWIDVDEPSRSKLLDFVARQGEDASAIQERVRQSELRSLSAWLTAACKDPSLLSVPIVIHDDLKIDESVVRHSRLDQVTRRFTIAIWSQLERCANCHSPERNAKQVAEHGDQMSWIVPCDPAMTLKSLVQRQLIDVKQPRSSLLRLKAVGLADHQAGVKFPDGGQTDQEWIGFLEDYAKTIHGQYDSADQLPPLPRERRWRSGLHLRIENLPENLDAGIYRVELYFQNPDGSVDSKPCAISESDVTKERRRWGNSLILVDTRDSLSASDWTRPIETADVMPSGKYRLRFVRTASATKTNAETSIRETTIEAPWPAGHSSALTLDFNRF